MIVLMLLLIIWALVSYKCSNCCHSPAAEGHPKALMYFRTAAAGSMPLPAALRWPLAGQFVSVWDCRRLSGMQNIEVLPV